MRVLSQRVKLWRSGASSGYRTEFGWPVVTTNLGGLHEFNEKCDSGLGDESTCCRWGRGSRSSRKGQSGGICEDLLSVRCWIFLHSTPRHLHQAWPLVARRPELQRG